LAQIVVGNDNYLRVVAASQKGHEEIQNIFASIVFII
jgi:hypothetical protein